MSRSNLARIPEPSFLTDNSLYVNDYGKAFDSAMMLPYVLGLDMVSRITSRSEGKKAIDLCTGPGHFARLLVQYLNFDKVDGVDLSDPMLLLAKKLAADNNLSMDKIDFYKSDVTNLNQFASKSYDLVSFMNGAHHLPTIEALTRAISEAERIVKPEGTVFIMDPVRPKTESLLEEYYKISSAGYKKQGLDFFASDFYDSLKASWTMEEVFSAIPSSTCRQWVHLRPFGFSTFQILIGIAEGREKIFINEGLHKKLTSLLIPKNCRTEWKMLRLTFQLAKKKSFKVHC